ncbi:MAG: hypothetical protein IT228_00635 [Flavobacteriales bacterium]|nr:hypothetical protein [Flavobacteriales bacterium]MCC6575826.1 hypothetical protein [Flavobacteriales bacterium]NUQ14248.1 hypothetical protein [Flavobacteriales bacterium]
MDYLPEPCQTVFTVCQVDRMHTAIMDWRDILVAPWNHYYTGIAGPNGCEPIVADATFTSNGPQFCTGDVGQFDGYVPVDSWTFTFIDPLGGSTGPSGGPGVPSASTTFAIAGQWQVTLSVVLAGNPAVFTSIVWVTDCSPITSECAQWYFGNYCSLDFSMGAPVAVGGSAMHSEDVPATACDPATGVMQFYASNLQAFNSGDVPLTPQFDGGLPSTYSSQGAVFVPNPGNPDRYYLFYTADQTQALRELHYTEVDVTLMTGGFSGDIAVADVSVDPAEPPTAEFLSAVPHCNGTDYWVVTLGVQGVAAGQILSYQVTTTGVLTPAVTSPNPVFTTSTLGFGRSGQIEFNSTGDMAAISFAGNSTCHLFSFDRATGTFDFLVTLAGNTCTGLGVAFSSSGDFLYTAWTSGAFAGRGIFQHDLRQLDLCAPQPPPNNFTPFPAPIFFASLQRGPDDKIYMSEYLRDDVSVIHDPETWNASPNDFGFQYQGVPLTIPGGVNEICLVGLPNMIDADPPLPTANDFTWDTGPDPDCSLACHDAQFFLEGCGDIIEWDVDCDGTIDGTGINFSYSFPGSGSFNVCMLIDGVQVAQHSVAVPACSGPFSITKTITPSNGGTYAGAPVLYTITVCNTSGTDQTGVNVTDLLPTDFVPHSNPLPQNSITLLANECQTFEITGSFTTLGTHTNTATLTQGGTSISSSVDIDVLDGCPMIVYGSGGCDPGDVVNMCLGMHTQLTNVSSVTYYIVYPDFLLPPTAGSIMGSISSPFAISSATIGSPISMGGWPPGYSAVQVTVNFTTLISPSPPYEFFCIDFAIDPNGPGAPPGQNAVWTWASTTPGVGGWNQVTVTANNADIDLWTQAYHIIFNGCPNLITPDASFTADVSDCGGKVTVHGNNNDPNAIHIWTWGDNRTTPINGAQNYTYDYFAWIYDNQGFPVNIPPAAPGTYTITHTVIVDGVAETATQTVDVGADVIIADLTYSSSISDIVGGSVDIEGQFFIDNDFFIGNAQVYLQPGAEIIVQNGWTLDIENSSFTACNGVMWKSITAENGATVRIRGSYMDDAESTVAALDGSVIWVDETQFHNNRVGIGIPDVGGTYNNVACWVSNSIFYSAGPMPQPYQGQASAVGSQGFAAVDVHNTSLDFTGGNNLIHSLSNGIVGHRSDLTVAECQMLNIQPDAAYAYTGNGSGIYANGLLGWNTLKQQGYGMNSSLPSFNGCRWGIYTEYMNVRSTDNRMLDMGTAYRVDRSGYREVDILENQVHTRYNGIELRANDGAAHILVEGNDITFGNDPACTACKGWTAIRVTEGNYVAPDSRIQNNTIHFLPQYASRFGIGLFAADRWIVAENDLSMVNNAFNRTGIWLNGCRATEVSCNTVNSSDNAYPVDAQAAIRNNMGSEPLISCNEMDRTANGILFNGVAYNTDVRGNQFHNHRWPLHLDATAIIDVQALKGNLWDPNAATPVWGAWYEVSSWQAGNYPFVYNPATIGNGSTVPPSWSPSNWFFNSAGTNYDCADHHGAHYCSQFGGERCKDCIRELDEKIASDSLENDPYTDETKWMLAADLYKKLDDAPSLLDSLPELDAFYTALQGSTTAAFKAIEDDQLALYNLDSSVVAQLQANQVQIDALMSLVKDGMEQLGDSTLTPAQRQGLLVGLSGYRQNINNLSAWNASALQLASTSKVLTAEGVKTANANIATSELIETNEKAVNEVYLATVGKNVDSFTTTQTADLFAIANQCPMLGGNAVFKARSLYWLIDDSYDFDDQALCLQHGIIVKSLAAQPINAVAVIPNPAVDEATLVLDHELDEPGSFVVYDAVGAEVMRQVVPIDMPRLAFSTASLAPALYHYQVRGPSGVIGVGKLTIVR